MSVEFSQKVRDEPTKEGKKKSKKKEKEQTKQSSKPIPGHDFAAWDKYNIDQALQELEDSSEDESGEAKPATKNAAPARWEFVTLVTGIGSRK